MRQFRHFQTEIDFQDRNHCVAGILYIFLCCFVMQSLTCPWKRFPNYWMVLSCPYLVGSRSGRLFLTPKSIGERAVFFVGFLLIVLLLHVEYSATIPFLLLGMQALSGGGQCLFCGPRHCFGGMERKRSSSWTLLRRQKQKATLHDDSCQGQNDINKSGHVYLAILYLFILIEIM